MAESRADSEGSSEYSDSDSCGSSCYSGSDEDLLYFPWLEKVNSLGELFYIGTNFSFSESSEANLLDNEKQDLYSMSMKSGKTKLNAAKKFKKWVKKRRRKTRKSFPLSKQSQFIENTNNSISESLLLYPSKEIYLDVENPRQTIGRRVSLSEELLGLEFGVYEDIVADYLKVINFAPGFTGPDIKIGDCLKSINNIPVNSNNIDDILKGLSLPSKVKLTFLPVKLENKIEFNIDQDVLLKEILGDYNVLLEARSQLLTVSHGVFYLVIEDDDSVTNESIMYRFPDEDSSIFKLKGMFLTLSHLISKIASPPVLSCSLSIQGELTHVGFYKEGNDTLVLALPAKCCTVSEVQHFVTNISKLLKYQFSSLKTAFAVGNVDKKLDNFFTVFLKHYIFKYSSRKQYFDSHLLEILPSVQWLPLSTDLKTEIDDILSELESADFGSSSEGFEENQRIYSILGSCLFYKGYLLNNHLPKQDLLDVHLFLQYYHILLLTKLRQVSEIVIWKEVFPSRRNQPCFSDPEFPEVDGRWFLLIVAMHHCVLSVILEAGGCTVSAYEHPPPEPFYVEEVQNTLIILHNCGITSAVEKTMNHCLPPIGNPNSLLKESSAMKSLFAFFSNSGNTSNNSRTFSNSSAQLNSSQEKGSADGESDIESVYSDMSNENISHIGRSSRSYSLSTGSTTESQGSSDFSSLSHTFKLKAQVSNNTDGSSLGCENSTWSITQSVVAGFENTLFQYLHMDPVEGVYLAPLDDNTLLQEAVLKDIWSNFYRCCLNLRTVFARSLRNEEIIKSSIPTKYGVNGFLRNAYEQGVSFRYFHKDGTKQKISMTFWVIGRLFFSPEPRELYVCYHDSSRQDIVEMAFKLGFGVSL